jgi:GntR family transcriptional regulator, rspAB operon transcriptional repressor
MASTAVKKAAANNNAATDAAPQAVAPPDTVLAGTTPAGTTLAGGGTAGGTLAGLSVFEVLRERIVSLDLAPGTVLNRAELQVQFSLSSTPIRDALMRLADDGLLEIIPQSVTRVSLIDVELARQALFLRRAVELEVVRTLAGLSDKAFLPELIEFVTVQKGLASAQDVTAFYASDRAFHRRLYELAGAPDLWALVRQRSGHIDRIRRLDLPAVGKMAQIVRDHGSIIAAVATGDATSAQLQMRDHLSRSIGLSQALQDAHPTYFKA